MSLKPYSRTGSPCEHCRWRARAEESPSSLLARIWRWHTRWCPGWKSYQRDLARLEGKPDAHARADGGGDGGVS